MRPGDRIPGIPADSAKVRLDYEMGERVSLGASVIYAASQYARGDENNRDRNGRIPAYAVIDLDAHYLPTPQLELFARVANAFDRRYESGLRYAFGAPTRND